MGSKGLGSERKLGDKLINVLFDQLGLAGFGHQSKVVVLGIIAGASARSQQCVATIASRSSAGDGRVDEGRVDQRPQMLGDFFSSMFGPEFGWCIIAA